MKRKILDDLVAWHRRERRKPLLLQGARQVGKTYSLKEFGAVNFQRVHYVNFEENPSFISVFGGDLAPAGILRDLSIAFGVSINPESDLLILDEIQQCPPALTSLKYFAESMPELPVCAAGSLLGVHLGQVSYPVGKVDELRMHPMTFEEFLLSGGNPALIEAYAAIRELAPLTPMLHQRLWEEFKLYLVVGGLPEGVASFQRLREHAVEAFQEVRRIQEQLVSAYAADMAKHCGKQNAMHLERLWRQIPVQLGRDQNGGAPKFVFKDVVPGIKGYERLAGVIDWLEMAGLLIRVPIVNSGQLPFNAFSKENAFKLFVFDVGILGALGRLPVRRVLDYDYGTYKGYYAENFLAQTFLAGGRVPIACCREGTAEVEFLTEVEGAVVPVEVKSGQVTQAKSLTSFASKYHPAHAVIFSGRNAGHDARLARHYYPLYLADKFPLPVRTERG